MTLPAKLPIKGSQAKAETGLASMKAAGVALGLKTPFKMSAMVGKTYGNLIFTPIAILAPSMYGVGSGKGTVNRNTVGGNFAGLAAFLFTIGKTAAASTVALQLNNKRQKSYSIFVKNNGKTYNLTQAAAANTYAITGTAANEFANLVKANVNKQIICVVTPK